MKNFLKYTIMTLVAIIFANCSVSAQVGKKSHVSKTIGIVIENNKTIPIFIGSHSDSKESSGITGWTEIKPNDRKAFEVFPDSVLVKRKARPRLVFRITNDKANLSAGENKVLMFSKLKTIIHIGDTKAEAEAFISDQAREQGVGFATNEMVNNTTACILKNNSSVSVTFSDPGHPFYGKTLASKDFLAISATQKKLLVSTGFKDSKISIIMIEGDGPIKTAKTLPIYENSSLVTLTDDFFDLSLRESDSKVRPMKIRTNAKFDVTIEGAFDSKGNSTVYVLPGGAKGEKGKIVYLKYGENYLNLKYSYKDECSQALIVRATERSVKYLNFQSTGYLKGKFIVTVK